MKKLFTSKTYVGEGEEHERALDDVFGIWVTVRSCCEKRIKTKLCSCDEIEKKIERGPGGEEKEENREVVPSLLCFPL